MSTHVGTVECAKMQNQRSRANGAKRAPKGGGGTFGDGAGSSSVPLGVGLPNEVSHSAATHMTTSIHDALDDIG